MAKNYFCIAKKPEVLNTNKTAAIVSMVFAALLLVCCSPAKNTPMRRGYHNLTAKYNVYFNKRFIIDIK